MKEVAPVDNLADSEDDGRDIDINKVNTFKVCVNRKGVIKHSFLTKTVSLVLLK